MRRVTVFLVLLAGVLALAVPAGAQRTTAGTAGTRANPPFIIDGPTYDDFLDAYIFNPNIAIIAEDADLATIEIDESVHSCTGSAGSNSIWFATYLPAGKLTLDTAGSAFVTGSGTTDDTVISLYRLTGDLNVIDFTKLAPVACATGDAGAGKLKLDIIEATYLVQVSLQAAETALTGSQVSLLAKFKSALSLAVDDIAGARSLFFPKLYSFALSKHATIDLNEPVDPAFDPAVPLQKSVWFKFTLTTTNLISVIAQAGFGASTASIFRVEPNGSLTSIPYDQADFISLFAWGVLSPGNYVVRLAFPTEQIELFELAEFSNVSASLMVATINLTPLNYGFGTGEGDPGAASSMDGWTVKNGDVDDQPVCEFEPDKCGFMFVSSGPGEATQLVAKANLSGVKMKRGEMIEMGFQGSYTGDGHVRLTVDLIDANGQKVTFSNEYYPQDFQTFGSASLEPLAISIQPVKVKIKIEMLSTTLGDTVTIDDVYILPLRVGTPLPRGLGVLPLPPAPR